MPNTLSQFWQELKRRKVIRVITVYAAASFVILELVSMSEEPFGLPEWTFVLAVILLSIGFLIAIILSWIYDIHPEGGVVKTEPAHKVKPEDVPKSSNSWKIASYISFVVIVGIVLTTSIQAQEKVIQEDPACGEQTEQLPRLTQLEFRSGYINNGGTECFSVSLQQGEFIRASLELETGYIQVRVLEPREYNPILVSWGWGKEYLNSPTLPIAFEAPTSGLYIVELSVPFSSWWEEMETVGFRLQIDEWLSAKTQSVRQEDLRNDPQTAFLREYAEPIRSIDPKDEDFSDLEFLREQLRGVRVLLLGEGGPGHGGGSELEAKTRIVKFLHQEMDFDVLAFEAGIFGTSLAWSALQTDENPRKAFLKGVPGVWGWSEQVQPLIHYLAASTHTDHPLEITGFDMQFTLTPSKKFLLLNLREFLTQNEIDSPLLDPDSPPSRILEGFLDGRFSGDQKLLPEPSEQAKLLEILQVTATQVEKTVSGREGLFWAQVLRNLSFQIDQYLNLLRNENMRTSLADGIVDRWAYVRARSIQMAENLLWMVDTYYPGQKIIVWEHMSHAMRNPHYTALWEPDFTMGDGVYEALGKESFVIGFTAYNGASGCVTCTDGLEGMRQNIIADQNPSFEFEELMEAAGHEFAWVNLRAARTKGQWLGGTFLARPICDFTDRAPWSEVLDALFFIRTAEPSQRITGLR